MALPAYDSFRLHLSRKVWKALRRFHDENDDSDCYWIEDFGVVKSFITPYGNERYSLTHKGKIPFGDLSLNLFNQFQEPLIRERHNALEQTALAALCTAEENTALIDLRLFRAQMRRILETTLYFIEVRTGADIFHKIGVTTRLLEMWLIEIRTDLTPHFGSIELISLGTWAHRGNIELYFKHRYRRFQQSIGTLTEYFAFEDVKAVLRDLRCMKPKELDETEDAILVGEPSRVERHELTHNETLSEQAWRLLWNFSNDEAKRNFEARLELQNHRLGERTRPLIEFVSTYPELRLQVTDYGRTYQERFAEQYQRIYAAKVTESA